MNIRRVRIRWWLIVVGICLASPADAQVRVTKVACSSTPGPLPGTYWAPYLGESWSFPVSSWTRIGPLNSTMSSYNISPSPVYSHVSGGRQVRWSDPGILAECQLVEVVTPNAVIRDWVYNAIHLYGMMQVYRSGLGEGEDEGCDYQITPDPEQCQAEDDWSPDGGEREPDQPTGADPNWCAELKLEPGCYDVYIDDQYDSTICCN